MSEKTTVERAQVFIPDRFHVTKVIVDPALTHLDSLVALAHDESTNADVVVKIKDRDQLENEANILESLNHPQIPKVVKGDIDRSIPYLATQSMPNDELLHKYLIGHPNPNLVARLCLSALDPIAYVHERRMGHFDLKPENLGLTISSPVSLLDFELARPFGEEPAVALHPAANSAEPSHERTTMFGNVPGTPGFLSPQRRRGEPGNEGDDIYSVGATVRELVGANPGFLAPVVECAMADKREERYGSATEMADHIRQLAGPRVLEALAA